MYAATAAYSQMLTPGKTSLYVISAMHKPPYF